jgi:hypothetical protein
MVRPVIDATLRPVRLLWLVSGFTIWNLALIGLYVLHTAGCDFGWNRVDVGAVTLHRALLLGLWALHLIALLLLLRSAVRIFKRDRQRRGAHRFLAAAALWTTVWAALGALWIGVPLFAATAGL